MADPYRWMEDLDSPAVADWVAAQNARDLRLSRRSCRRARDSSSGSPELWDYPKVSVPVREGGRYFYTKNSGLQRQAPLYVRASLTSEPSLVLDPNLLSPGRHGLASAVGAVAGRQAAGVRPVGRRRRLADASRPRGGHRQGPHRRREVDAVFRALLDEGLEGLLLLALSGAAGREGAAGGAVRPGALLPPRRHAAVRGSPGLRAQRPAGVVHQRLDDRGRQVPADLHFEGSDNNNRLHYADLGDPMRPDVAAPVKPLVEDDDAEFNAFGNRGPVLLPPHRSRRTQPQGDRD